MSSSLRIIVTGLITQHPRLGGITWHYLQYMLGLAELGHDVYYFEDSGEFPYVLDVGASGTDWTAWDCTYHVGYIRQIMARYGFEDKWAYHFPPKSTWYGLSDHLRRDILQSADLLINVSGTLENPNNYRRIPHLLYIDTDPVVTQIKILLGNSAFNERVDVHDTHFSFGESFSEAVPPTEYAWRPTRQPILLSEWDPNTSRRDRFTTVMNWTSYEPLIYAGQTYGQKDVEFKRFLELPSLVIPGLMEVALGGIQHRSWETEDDIMVLESGGGAGEKTSQNPVELLARAGWRVVDAIEHCGDLDAYRDYIETSKAEWSVAKNAYVLGQPGWFSERSACYLAAGRPVIVQDTGLSSTLPIGEGILSFRTLDEAAAAVLEVEANYLRHAEAARDIAETYFDSGKVLTRLISEAMEGNDRLTSIDQ